MYAKREKKNTYQHIHVGMIKTKNSTQEQRHCLHHEKWANQCAYITTLKDENSTAPVLEPAAAVYPVLTAPVCAAPADVGPKLGIE